MAKYKISGWLYLIFGGAIAGYSQFIMLNPDVEKTLVFNFFFYVGLAFIVIGLFKVLMKFILNKKENSLNSNFEDNTVNNKIISQNPKIRFTYCSNCGSKNYSTYNYCYKCGNRLK